MQCCLPALGVCSRVQIALKDFDFLLLNPALHTEIILRHVSFFLGNKPQTNGCRLRCFSLSPAWVCVLRMDAHVHTKESDLKSPSTIAGIQFQHRNKQKDPFLHGVTQTLSSGRLVSCRGGCVRTAIVPVLPGGVGGGRANKLSERRAQDGAYSSAAASCPGDRRVPRP